MAKITINNQICECEENEYILQIARANGIFIPAICYLSGCSPTLACRLCMVEADGKRVYACNAKAKDGMVVITDTPEIASERKAIMQTYCINHPLECGVCDQSGECELQNFVHHLGVDEQIYAIKDTHKTPKSWGLINYDPSLCIVCERCITVCKDKIGEAALKTTARGGDMPDKALKDSMPKDAFAVWNKFQKSLIAPANGENLECSSCGECTAVCPVGALVGSKFQYSSNAWELTKIPASNPHSSDCELIYYDIKRSGIEDQKERIYRVSNDYDFGEISTAARFGYDFSKTKSVKNEEIFEKIVKNIENGEIKTIKFNSFITNEEAKILSLLKEKFDLNLVNDEAFAYQNFMKEFAKFSGEGLYNATSETIKNSDFIVVCGSFLRSDSPNLGFKVNNALKINKAGGIYFHTINDKVVENYAKNFICVKHKSEFDTQILLWILQKFGENLPSWLNEKLQNEFEISQISKTQKNENGEEITQTSEVKTSKFAKMLKLDEAKVSEILAKKEKFSLIIGEDFIFSKNAKTLAKLAGLIQKFTPFKILIIPPRTNSLGVSLICDLDKDAKGKVLGYNENGDITMGVLKDDLDMPSLIQQEGTFTNYDKRVVPTNAALSYGGFELNDIANALGVKSEFAIDYTSNLGKNFKNIKFDDLENFYDNGGVNHRGYELENQICECETGEFEITNSDETLNLNENEVQIYKANPIHQFSKFTNATSQLNEVANLIVGSEFLTKFGLSDGEVVTLKKGEFVLAIAVKLDKNLQGAILPYFDEKIEFDKFFENGRYSVVSVEKAKA